MGLLVREDAVTENDYVYRRVLYDGMVLARACHGLSQESADYEAAEALKVAGLIKVRSLESFLTDDIPYKDKKAKTTRSHPDDATIRDFGLPVLRFLLTRTTEKPDGTKELGEKERIDKSVAHAVKKKEVVFRNPEAISLAKRILKATVEEFLNPVKQRRLAKPSGNAPKYAAYLRQVLPLLGLPDLE